MREIFNLVYKTLMFIATITGFTYKEVNIIIWFILIPFIWCFLIDKIVKGHYFKVSFLIVVICFLILIEDFNQFSNTLFHQSAEFLRSFNIIGSDYIASSVLICVFVPILIFTILIKRAYFYKNN